ncbi:unnamed protein product [Prorocentrum cordatum]|uniref:Uncharacterized protein n=1 Tax=Prorocentrum cordatum TaxID=2364126 RepID=A0ABN9TSX3_9DINO|nr:unnamed protein product [Polarella glacialis]
MLPATPRKLNQELANATTSSAVLRVIGSHLPEFDAINVVTALHKLARRQAAALRTAPRRSRARCATGCWGSAAAPRACRRGSWRPPCGRWRHSGPSLSAPRALADGALLRAVDFNPQDCANTLWAVAAARAEHPALVQALCATAAAKLRRFRPQECANAVWAVAALRAQESRSSRSGPSGRSAEAPRS